MVPFDNPCKKTHRKPPNPGFQHHRFAEPRLLVFAWCFGATSLLEAPSLRRKTGRRGGRFGRSKREVKSEESKQNGTNKFYAIFFNVCFYIFWSLFGKVGMSEWNVFVDCSSEVSKEKTKETLILLVLSTQTNPIKNSQAKNNWTKKQGGLSSVQFIFFPFTKFLGLSGYLGGSSCHKVCMADGLGRFSWPYIAHSIRGTPSPSYPRDGRAGWTTKAQ